MKINNIFWLVEQRLALQSTRRYIEANYKLPNYTVKYFQSAEFKGIFNSWPPDKQENFLVNIAGNKRGQFKKILVEN